MARSLRIEYPGAVYHIISRGNEKKNIYLGTDDYTLFLNLFKKVIKRYNWICHSYCLMSNHYHLLIETIDPNLSLGMRQLNSTYSQWFNKRHERVGHLFQGRYKSILVEKQAYLLELIRYIVLNPIRANVTDLPDHYRWSSYRHTMGLGCDLDISSNDWVLQQFSDNYDDARRAFKRFVLEVINDSSTLISTTDKNILGSKNFISNIEHLLKTKKPIKEIPKKYRYADRPPLNTLMTENASANKNYRNKRIVKFYNEHGYTMVEIAKSCGLHYTTVSNILKKS